MFLNFSWVQPIYKFLSPKNINIKNQGSAQYQEDRDQQSHVVPQRRFAYSYQKARQGFGQVRAYLAQSHGTVLSLSLTLSIAFNNLLVLTFIWVCSNFSFYMWFSIYVLFVISFRFWVLLSHHYFVENVVGFKRIGLICYGLNSAWF